MNDVHCNISKVTSKTVVTTSFMSYKLHKLKPNSITLDGSELVRSRIPSRYLVRTSFEPVSIMEFDFWQATSCIV